MVQWTPLAELRGGGEGEEEEEEEGGRGRGWYINTLPNMTSRATTVNMGIRGIKCNVCISFFEV